MQLNGRRRVSVLHRRALAGCRMRHADSNGPSKDWGSRGALKLSRRFGLIGAISLVQGLKCPRQDPDVRCTHSETSAACKIY